MTFKTPAHVLLVLLAIAAPAYAAPPAGMPALAEKGGASCRWTSGFHHQGLGSIPRRSVVLDDGTGPALYLAGLFETADDLLVNRVTKWDGAAFHPFGDGFDGEVLDLEVFDDGNGPALYAAGRFTKSGSTVVNGIAKWNGAEWLPLGSGLAEPFWMGGHVLEVFDDGSGPALYVGGNFDSAGGVPAKDLAKWDGSSWSAVGLGTDPDGWIWGLAIGDLGDGPKLYISGAFVELDGQPIKSVAKWDGTTFSPLGPGIDGWIGSLKFFDDGSGLRLFAAGVFWWEGIPRAIVAWNGSSWATVGQYLNGQVLDLVVHDDGTGPALYATGEFQYADFDPLPLIGKWDGSSWSPVDGGLTGSFGNSLASFDDGGGADLYVGGFFTLASGQPIPNFARWDGASWSKVTAGVIGRGLSASVRVLTSFDSGSGKDLYAGGEFLEAGNVAASHIARWDGAAWSALGSGTNGNVLAMAVFDDGAGPALYAGGEFTTAGGAPANRVAKWTGSAWEPLGAGIDGAVHALEVFDDGGGPALYAGGLFSTAGGRSAANIAKWDGSSWSALGAGTSDAVLALEVFDPGTGPRLFAGGVFGSAGGQPAGFLANWDGAWSAVPGSPNRRVYALEAFDFGAGRSLYLGGDVPASGAASNPLVYQWNGLAWTALAAGSGMDVSVVDFASFDDGSGPALFAGGRFTQADGLPANNVARWNGSSWSALGTGIRAYWLEDVEVFDDGSGPALYAAGGFETAGGIVSRSLARYSCSGAPTLAVPALSHAAAGSTLSLPVELDPAGVTLGAVAFSLDYDQACLDPDANDDGVLDQVEWSVPPGFSTTVNFDPLDPHGEIDLAIFDAAPPIAQLAAGVVVRVRFKATCAGPADAPVLFSAFPAPSFGDLRAHDVAGSSRGGLVRILAGPRGDCNGNSLLAVADLTAVGLEIFDGDGSFWLDAPSPSYVGSPVGCDANATTQITAADVTCANRLLFGLACAPALGELAAAAPILELSTGFASGVVWLRGRLEPNGGVVASLAFSLDLDPARFDLAAVDADHDGTPDRLRFPQGSPGLALVSFSAGDPDGELDVLLASLSGGPLPGGLLIEVGIPAAALPAGGVAYSADPAPSFGSVAGGDLPGLPVLGDLLFSDGFESGHTGLWSTTLP